MHAHCRFLLRGGKEVFGVIWQTDPLPSSLLRFTTIGDYERAKRDPQQPIDVVSVPREEILLVERLNTV